MTRASSAARFVHLLEDLRSDSWLTQSFWNEFGSRARRIHVEQAAKVNETIPLIKLERGLIGN